MILEARTEMPGMTMTVEDMVVDGDKVWARSVARTVHPATGDEVTLTVFICAGSRTGESSNTGACRTDTRCCTSSAQSAPWSGRSPRWVCRIAEAGSDGNRDVVMFGRKMMGASTMLKRLRPRSGYDLVAVLALVLALGGGTAMAAVIRQFQLADRAQHHLRLETASQYHDKDNVANGSIDTSDLFANARPHRLKFNKPATTPCIRSPRWATSRLSGFCRTTGSGNTALEVECPERDRASSEPSTTSLISESHAERQCRAWSTPRASTSAPGRRTRWTTSNPSSTTISLLDDFAQVEGQVWCSRRPVG